MEKDTYFFPHDYMAQEDKKLQKAKRAHGLISYAIYFCIVEYIYRDGGQIEYDTEFLSYKLDVDENLLKQVCENFDLFKFEDGKIYSESINRRLEIRREKSEKYRKNALQKKQLQSNSSPIAEPLPTDCAIKERKGKEIKGKEKKEKEIKENALSREDFYFSFFNEFICQQFPTDWNHITKIYTGETDNRELSKYIQSNFPFEISVFADKPFLTKLFLSIQTEAKTDITTFFNETLAKFLKDKSDNWDPEYIKNRNYLKNYMMKVCKDYQPEPEDMTEKIQEQRTIYVGIRQLFDSGECDMDKYPEYQCEKETKIFFNLLRKNVRSLIYKLYPDWQKHDITIVRHYQQHFTNNCMQDQKVADYLKTLSTYIDAENSMFEKSHKALA